MDADWCPCTRWHARFTVFKANFEHEPAVKELSQFLQLGTDTFLRTIGQPEHEVKSRGRVRRSRPKSANPLPHSLPFPSPALVAAPAPPCPPGCPPLSTLFLGCANLCCSLTCATFRCKEGGLHVLVFCRTRPLPWADWCICRDRGAPAQNGCCVQAVCRLCAGCMQAIHARATATVLTVL